jgi:hypothetical protein
MTMTDYEKARDLVKKIEEVKGKIFDLRTILDSGSNVSSWRMEIRQFEMMSLKNIDHCGMLPEFLQAILSKHIEELHKLESELEKL